MSIIDYTLNKYYMLFGTYLNLLPLNLVILYMSWKMVILSVGTMLNLWLSQWLIYTHTHTHVVVGHSPPGGGGNLGLSVNNIYA